MRKFRRKRCNAEDAELRAINFCCEKTCCIGNPMFKYLLYPVCIVCRLFGETGSSPAHQFRMITETVVFTMLGIMTTNIHKDTRWRNSSQNGGRSKHANCIYTYLLSLSVPAVLFKRYWRAICYCLIWPPNDSTNSTKFVTTFIFAMSLDDDDG